MYNFDITPKVYRSNEKQRIYVCISEPCERVELKIQPMESYSIEHTPSYRINEGDRYPFIEATRGEDGIFSLEYDFVGEQKYSVNLKIDGSAVRGERYIFAAKADILAHKVFKCDTHLHSCRSDGEKTPFAVGIDYRAAGFDFIAITDHHKMFPSVEAQEQFEQLTDEFFVLRAEEVHNKSMGYFHIINLGGKKSVNEIIEADDGFAEAEVDRRLKNDSYPDGTTPYICAYRNFVSDMIRQHGGLAVMAHPFWACYGEYNMPAADVRHLLKSGCYDALELFAGCDMNGNGNNLQLALWQELLCDGVKIPVLGASDAHSTRPDDSESLFNLQFSLIFAKDKGDVLDAIREGRCVAVSRRSDEDFLVIGSYRLVNYARFMLYEYFPKYTALCREHAAALESCNAESIAEAEQAIAKYRNSFYSN